MRGVFICGVLVACGAGKVATLERMPVRPDAPLRIAFGDCTTTDVSFVSGPWPAAFRDEVAPPTEAPIQSGSFASLTGTGDISSGFDDSNIYGGLLGTEADEFGYGTTGLGPGGGGTGWGTIGTGRYGTIGHGTSTSSPPTGGMRGRSASAPTISIGQPNAKGDLDTAIIRRYIKRNVQKLEYCYEKQ